MVRSVTVSGLCLAGLLVSGNVWAAEGDSGGLAGSGEVAGRGGMHNSVSLLGNFGYAYSAGSGFGLSGRYQYSVIPEGFIKSGEITDDFGLEGAVDFFHYSWDFLGYSWTYNEFALSANAIWNVWFTKDFAAYPRLGIGFRFGSWSGNDGLIHPGGYGGLFLLGGAGVLYELDPITLRAEVSNASLGLGVAIPL